MPRDRRTLEKEFQELRITSFNDQMNAHFVFNALNGIQYFITVDNKKEALSHLSTFGKLIRLYLKGIQNETVLLSDEIKIMEEYLKLQQLRHKELSQSYINIEMPTQNLQSRIPPYMLSMLFENIIEEIISDVANNYNLTLYLNIESDSVKAVLKIRTLSKEKEYQFSSAINNRLKSWKDKIDNLNKLKPYDKT